jgi:TonB family protein
MMQRAPKADRREDGARTSATILPFRLRAVRELSAAADGKAPKIRLKPANDGKSKRTRKAKTIEKDERPTFVIPRYRGWIKQAIIGSAILHLVAFAFFQIRFVADVERAANSGGVLSSDGAVVLDVEVVADSQIAPSKTNTNMTAPDAKTKSTQTPREEQKEKQKEIQKAPPIPAPNPSPELALPQEEQAAPQKTETAIAPQSPNQQKTDQQQKPDAQQVQRHKAAEQKKKQEKAAPSAAAAPAKTAATRNDRGQTGANGNLQTGGQANATAYNQQVLAHLQRFRVYPEAARGAGVTGVSTVRFTLASNGAVMSVSLGVSSGAAVLDQAALAMVKRASPFPPIPPALGRASMSFAAPVRFNLR